MSKQLKAIKCPSDELSLTNCAILNPREFDSIKHVEIIGQSSSYIFTARTDNTCPLGQIGFSAPQRKWAMISIDLPITIRPFQYDLKSQSISVIVVELDFVTKKKYYSYF